MQPIPQIKNIPAKIAVIIGTMLSTRKLERDLQQVVSAYNFSVLW